MLVESTIQSPLPLFTGIIVHEEGGTIPSVTHSSIQLSRKIAIK